MMRKILVAISLVAMFALGVYVERYKQLLSEIHIDYRNSITEFLYGCTDENNSTDSNETTVIGGVDFKVILPNELKD